MPGADNRKIMLVEDDDSMKDVLATLLEIEGYQVVIAPDRQPLEVIMQSVQAAQPNVILIDVHLSRTSGYDILGLLRADPSFTRTRVVMSSGMDVREQCISAGADAFLLKPYMPDELLNSLAG